MISKILSVLASFYIGKLVNRGKPTSLFLFELAVSESRKVVMMVVGAITVCMLLAGGILVALVGAVQWMDETARPTLLYAGLGLSFVSLIVFTVVFSRKNWHLSQESQMKIREREETPSVPSSLEEIISALIQDITTGMSGGAAAQAQAHAQAQAEAQMAEAAAYSGLRTNLQRPQGETAANHVEAL